MINKFGSLLILYSLFLFTLASAIDVPFTDSYTSSGTSTSDRVTWGGYSIYFNFVNINSQADCLCIDWCDDGADDNTFSNWDTCSCGSEAQKSSCMSYSSWVNSLCNQGKCAVESLGSNHDINSGNNGDKWSCKIDVREYRDCDNSAGQQGTYNHYVGPSGKDSIPYYVIASKKYDCDDNFDYDLEGLYGLDQWVDFKKDQSCTAGKVCDENHDDDFVYTATGNINDACRTINWASCGASSDCISDYCAGGECSSCNPSNQCTSTYWNQCYNNGARCCSGDAINYQYFCDYNEAWAECTQANHVDGQAKDSYTCSNASEAWHWTAEDDLSSTQCDYYLSKSNGENCDCTAECSSNRCFGTWQGVYQCKPVWDCASENKFTPNADQCCSGLDWNPLTKECYNALQPNLSVSPYWLVFEI